MNPIVDLLTRAKARTLAHPCRTAYARDKYGSPTPPRDSGAVCWCSLGALYYEAPDEDTRLAARALLFAACDQLAKDNPGAINDNDPDLIPQMFDLAIEEASR